VWGEGASDLWGRLERADNESVRLSSWRRCERLRGDEDQAGDDGDESLTGLAAA
jgi:hypothetical protein